MGDFLIHFDNFYNTQIKRKNFIFLNFLTVFSEIFQIIVASIFALYRKTIFSVRDHIVTDTREIWNTSIRLSISSPLLLSILSSICRFIPSFSSKCVYRYESWFLSFSTFYFLCARAIIRSRCESITWKWGIIWNERLWYSFKLVFIIYIWKLHPRL